MQRIIKLKDLLHEQTTAPQDMFPATYEDLDDTQKADFDAWADQNYSHMDKITAYDEYGYLQWWLGSLQDGGQGHNTEDGTEFEDGGDGGDEDEDGNIKWIKTLFDVEITVTEIAVYSFLIGQTILSGKRLIRQGTFKKTAGELGAIAFPIYNTMLKIPIGGYNSFMGMIAAKRLSREKGAVKETMEYLSGARSLDDLVKATTKEEKQMLKQFRRAALRGDINITKLIKEITKPLLADITKGKATVGVVKQLLGKNYKNYKLYDTALSIQLEKATKYGPEYYKNARTTL